MPDDARAVATVAGKALEAAIVVLYVAAMTGALYGSVLPDYRTATGAELADRTLADAARDVETAIPPDGLPGTAGANATARTEVDASLPGRIRGAAYAIRAANDSALVLEHPHASIGGRATLALPASVSTVEGSWTSTGGAAVRVERTGDEVRVRLVVR